MRYISLLVLALSSYCFGGTINPNVDDSRYVAYGKKHKCVLMLEAIAKEDTKINKNTGSCVLIDRQIAITSAHLLQNSFASFVTDDYNNTVQVDYFVYPKGFDKGEAKNDIAIIHLKKPIDIQYYPEIYTEQDEDKKICSISGFGLFGTYDKGVSRTQTKAQIRRAGSNIVDGCGNGIIECSVGNNKITELEFLISSGDSGGGLFIDKKLAGINCGIYTLSRDKNLNSDYMDHSMHVRVSDHKTWIKSIATIMRINDAR